MRVAIATQGGDLDALVDPRFGRARWFVIADLRTGEWQAHDNIANTNAAGGAGPLAGEFLMEHGADAVIAGHVGPKAHKALAAASISVHQAGNGIRAREALAALRCGELPALEEPTIDGPWS